ncbi:peptidoglycan DD-metalloendopeptidase family protein [Bartonella sp. B10]
MYLKVLSSVFWYNCHVIAFLVMTIVIAGCSSDTQRFSNIFPNNRVSTRSNSPTIMPSNPRMLSHSGMIHSTELPPVEPNDTASYNSSSKGKDFFSDSKITGVPPRSLGTLSRSQMDDTPIFQKNSYIVQSGDTLLSISQQIGVSVDALKFVNGINHDSIYIGQVLIIPNKRTVASSSKKSNNRYDNQFLSTKESSLQSQATSSVKYRNDSSMSKTPVTTIFSSKIDKSDAEQNFSKKIIPLSHTNDLSTNVDNVATPQATGISNMRWPVRGRLLSKFGQKKGTAVNRGIDIAVPEGSSVKAAENGVVIYASDGLKTLGNVVMIRHEGNIITIYGYNSRLVVDKGQRVRRGEEIAKSGISGDVKTPRVYFEVRKGSVPVDPVEYLEN